MSNAEIKEIMKAMSELRKEMSALRGEISILNSKVGRLEENLGKLKDEFEYRYNLMEASFTSLARVILSAGKGSDDKPVFMVKYSYTGKGFNNFTKEETSAW